MLLRSFFDVFSMLFFYILSFYIMSFLYFCFSMFCRSMFCHRPVPPWINKESMKQNMKLYIVHVVMG